MFRPHATAAALLALVALSACAGGPPPTSAAAPMQDDRLTATLWVQRSVEFREATRQAYALATSRLPAALATQGSAALEQADGGAGKPPAVIFDVDETVLDNSPYEARMILAGRPGFDLAEWDRWVAERAATAVPGAVEFVTALKAAGVTPIYVTNRECRARPGSTTPCPQEADTLANLEAAGFGSVDPTHLMIKGEQPGWTSDKGSRRAAVAGEFRIVMLVGDQFGDLVSVGRGDDRATRDALADTHADLFATRWIVLPNPMYGAWLDVLPKPVTGALRP